MFTPINQRLAELEPKEAAFAREFALAQSRASRVEPRLEVSTFTAFAVSLAGAFGTVMAWSYLSNQDWILPITFIAALVLAVIEIVAAAATGACLYAVILDEPGEAFGLSPRQRTAAVASTCVCVSLTLFLTVWLALARGANGSPWLWIAIGLISVVLGAYCGAAAYENRFSLRAGAHERRLLRVRRKMDRCRHLHELERRAAMSRGRRLRAVADNTLDRAETAFERAWRRRHHGHEGVVPRLPRVELPTDAELSAAIIVPLYGSEAPDA